MDVDRLVEEVARAILAEAGRSNDPKIQRDLDPQMIGLSTLYARKYARSAILATLRGVREPDDGSLDAFHDALHSCQDDRFSECATAGITAVFDHLIKTVEG